MAINEIGNKYGRLTVIKRAGKAKNRSIKYLCHCSCGNKKIIRIDSLRRGITKSCGCINIKHNKSMTREYKTWVSMLNRCNNSNDSAYCYYGGRGITVCSRWLKLDNFLKDMGKKPKGLTLERKNNELGYFPENVRWASWTNQARNKRIYKNNNTGYHGVVWIEKYSKYRVQIRVDNRTIHIGLFETLENATTARKQAEEKYWR